MDVGKYLLYFLKYYKGVTPGTLKGRWVCVCVGGGGGGGGGLVNHTTLSLLRLDNWRWGCILYAAERVFQVCFSFQIHIYVTPSRLWLGLVSLTRIEADIISAQSNNYTTWCRLLDMEVGKSTCSVSWNITNVWHQGPVAWNICWNQT